MERYASGDDAAFPALRDALSPRLYNYIVRKVRDPDRAKELVHVTFIRIITARGSFVKGSNVTGWAFSILCHLYADQLKKKREQLLGDRDAEPASDDANPEESVASRELFALIREQLAQLPPLQREACEFVYYGHMTYAEAAEVLDASEASIKQRVHRAHLAIREALEHRTAERGQKA